MNSYKKILVFFILAAMVQIAIPSKMIYDWEDVLQNGKEYKFKTEPIDPVDPFRGRYINLRYHIETYISSDTIIKWNDPVNGYVLLENDSDGFAKINSLSRTRPLPIQDYVKAEIRTYSYTDTNTCYITFPFTQYYMDEFKAPRAEKIYNESLRDTTAVTYALINIKDGKGIIKDVVVNNKSIGEWAK